MTFKFVRRWYWGIKWGWWPRKEEPIFWFLFIGPLDIRVFETRQYKKYLEELRQKERKELIGIMK